MAPEVTGSFGWLEEEGCVLLVANWRRLEGRRVLCWDLPGGGVEGNESLEETCRRELLEETGYEVRVRDLAFMIERFGFRCEDPDVRSRYFFFCVERTGGSGKPEDPKIVESAFRPVAELGSICTEPYHRQVHAWLSSGRRQRYFVSLHRPGRRVRGREG